MLQTYLAALSRVARLDHLLDKPRRVRHHIGERRVLVGELISRDGDETPRRAGVESDTKVALARGGGHENGPRHGADQLGVPRVEVEQKVQATVGQYAMAAAA